MEKLRRSRLKLLWRRWYVKAAVATVVVLVFLVWNDTRHALNEDQVIALAQGVYARASSCKGSLATTANPPAIWGGETWTVRVAGPCGLKTFSVDDATGEVRELALGTPGAPAAPTRGSGNEGWTFGRILRLYIPGVEKVDQVSYVVGNENFVIRPSNPGNKLAVVDTTVVNNVSQRILLALDEKTASIADAKYNRLPILNPFKAATKVDSPGANAGKYMPFLWGKVELVKGYQVRGWLIFEISPGFDPKWLLWEDTESIRAPL